ncbi:endonuclease-reverse transcriptase domain-containing protein [Hirsutella rhossiliensis]|uniref:Endonuclease-reverse transcriptase domain-containing protein n=1 Tax=Hirsutella rhossiliensis TaxID=111463 RepID=A0A9P8N6S6_9HYPO|nr:endonuclease-reverse transcriptase domain-containing protein [Hirsutella rhossiliensis]KAH0968668.1 endonuclease-reverse transcriptase domain-containing protein [Hirsutella rhossiliensis]
MLAKMGSEMVELKHRVSEQSDTIRKLGATVYKQSTIIQGQEDLIRGLEAQVQESKEEFRRKSEEHDKEMKQEHRDLKRELVGVKEQLHQLMQKLDVSGEAALPSGPRATFADVARALPNSPPSTSTRSIPGPTKQQTANDSAHCTIDTSRVSESNRNKAQIGQIRQAIEVEMRAKNGHETWRDEAELQLVKEAAQKTAVEGARVMRDQLYPVRVDNANRTAILDAEGNILPGAIEALSAENRVTIGKISWLSKRESDLKDFAVLAISEPYARNIDGKVVTSPMGHRNWTKMIPTCVRDASWPIRSMLWIRSDLEAEQVSVPSADLTVAIVRLEGREVMVVSVYVEGKNNEALASAMEVLRDVIDRFRNGTGNRTDVVLAGDFNRHDLLWGGDEVSARRQGEGQPIVDLMDDFGLCSLLPRGTKTWQGPDKESTIDLVLASAELADEVISCVIHPTEHGSDHRAIQTTFDIQVPERTFPQRLLLRNAPWVAIAARVEDELRPLPWTVGVQTQADQLMRVVTKVLHDLTPRAQPPPYAKRWWTKDLTRLRRTYTYWRNQARAQRRVGQSRPDLEQRAKEAAKEYHDNVRSQKKTHWDDFVTDESNIWKALKYLKSGMEMVDDRVPPLRRADGSITEGKGEQAEELLCTFFPPLPARIEPEEIEEKVMAAKSWKAPGEDGLPAIVWKKLWHVVKHRERIYKAWRMGRVLSLISFDVKGAYNGVCKERLLERMKARGIPSRLVKRISDNGGSIAFVDDYSAWVTGPTAESNREGMQSIVDDAISWEKRSGATFEADKTSVIHFTRIAERDTDEPLTVKGKEIKPEKSVKLLGVVMDKALRFKEHIARAAAKGLAAAMCLKRLKMASPRTARQLFVATVAPTMDYASNRIGAQAVTGGFRTVATAVAEAEAGLQPFRERHAQAATRFWIRMRTLPKTHPLTSLRLKLNKRYASPMQKLASAMGGLDTKRLEVIHEFALAPWIDRLHVAQECDQVELVKPDELDGIVIATSSSQRKGLVGMGGVVRDASHNSPGEALASYSATVGPSDEQNAYTAGLAAIAMTLQCLPAGLRRGGMTIVTSNLSVLQVIARPRQQSGQPLPFDGYPPTKTSR